MSTPEDCAMIRAWAETVSAGCRHFQSQTLQLLTEIRDALRPQAGLMVQAEQQSLGIVKSVAIELEAAADALEQSAKQLKDDGKGWRAGQAKQAAMRARQAARELSGA